MKSIIVIGGGASGLIAALTASKSGAQVTIIEKNQRLGRKINVTGNGRCNITNLHINAEHYHGKNPSFVKNVLARFDQNDTETFFKESGVLLRSEPDGRVFPITNMAETVVAALEREILDQKIKVLLNTRVTGIEFVNNKFLIKLDNYKSINSDHAIIATGGKAYPQLGSTGEGYEFAQVLGHNIVPVRPALVPIEIEDTWSHKLQGTKVTVEMLLWLNGKVLTGDTDEMLFTHYGISGPLVLNMSREIGEHYQKAGFLLSLNLFPGYDKKSLLALLNNYWQTKPNREVSTALAGYLPYRLSKVLTENMDKEKKVINSLSNQEKSQMVDKLLRLPLKVKKIRPFTEAQVTVGGVNTDELNPQTMESRIVPGLYFCGEIMDIDGDCGGYNLQWAWSSGYVAGKSASS